MPGFPDLLRTWRKRRRYSQLDLALQAGLSQRHISFLETGRAHPSRFAVRQLGDALDIPAAETDALLRAAGFAGPSSTPTDATWDDDIRHAIDASIDHVLLGHEPYPAVAMDWQWTMFKANTAAQRFFAYADDGEERNILRAVVKPGPLRDSIVNWEDNARALLRQIELEVARRPSDPTATALLEELRDLAGLDPAPRKATTERPAPVLTLHMRIPDAGGNTTDLHLFSLIATIGMSSDAALDDLRIETLLPADAASRRWFTDNAN